VPSGIIKLICPPRELHVALIIEGKIDHLISNRLCSILVVLGIAFVHQCYLKFRDRT
jgi:hypothetical protein